MLDAGVDRLAPCGKRGGVMLHPETVVADLALTMLLGLVARLVRLPSALSRVDVTKLSTRS